MSKSMVRRKSIGLVVLLGCLAIPVAAEACSCARTVLHRGEIHRTAALFSGRCTKIEKTDWDLRVHFEVKTVWKGMLGQSAIVETASSEAACGYTFKVGRDYMVYAYDHGQPVPIRTNMCTHTKPLEKADRDKVMFGLGLKPEVVEAMKKKLVGSSGLYKIGSPIPFRIAYHGGVDGWSGRVRRGESGTPKMDGEVFLRIRQIRPAIRKLVAVKHEKEKAQMLRAADANKPFDVVVDLASHPKLQKPGRYEVVWGCRIHGGFELTHQSVIEILDKALKPAIPTK